MQSIRLVLPMLLFPTLILAACTPAPAVTATPSIPPIVPTTAIPPTQTPLPTATSTPTATATITPTPVPPSLLHDMATWPENMRTYYERDPSEWNNPTQEYIYDEEFHNQLIGMRRAFLAEQNIADAETMSEQALFYEYVRWGLENQQILSLSPYELRVLSSDPANVSVSYKEISDSGMTLHQGLFTLNQAQTNIASFQELVQQLLETRLSFPVFGVDITLPRMAYNGFIGNQAGLFRIPGVDPEQGIGILGHWNPAEGQHAWIPLVTHFSPYTYHGGDIGIYFDQTLIISSEMTMVGAHTGPIGNVGKWLTLEDFINNVGLKIHAIPEYSPDASIEGGFPWQVGLEGAQRFDFPDASSPHFPPTQYPWTP
jgi:hypothetical protein